MARDPDEMGHWLNKMVEYWRADNASAGLSVLAHKALPQDGRDIVARALQEFPTSDRRTMLSRILEGPSIG